jgi:hypothetical protein
MNEPKVAIPRVLPRLTRRAFFGGAGAAGAGLALGPAMALPVLADEDRDNSIFSLRVSPNEIPHITNGPGGSKLHFYFPGNVQGGACPTDPTGVHPARDPSVVYDFKGVIGQADLDFHGTGTDLTTGASAPYHFHTDTRFMKGEFHGTDGRTHRGSFAFI